MASVFCSTRFFITPMRSLNDCCMRVICCWSCSTWVCSCTISLLTAHAGGGNDALRRIKKRQELKATRCDFIIPFDAKNTACVQSKLGGSAKVNKGAGDKEINAFPLFARLPGQDLSLIHI